MINLGGILVANFFGVLCLLDGFYLSVEQSKHNCDTIEIIRIDTLSNHFILESHLNGNKSQFVKIVVKKQNILLDTVSIGQVCCLKLFDYASPWVDANGNEHDLYSMPYCVDLDDLDEVCIDKIKFDKLFYYP